uniref:Uncharacterized protein n=1 Tax=Candidatus Kentrum sp. LPFa TaxID=2126335 RepID=A0A450W249_9GAMM|nr:MAG: hypothetical protein BECKLPF1236B_GA0070989_101915 [Candidatus Kentron sp. LPFa]
MGGKRLVRTPTRTRPERFVHKVLGNIAETELCHPWLLDSANPWRNDGDDFNVTTTPMAPLRFGKKAGNQDQEWDTTHEFFEEPQISEASPESNEP